MWRKIKIERIPFLFMEKNRFRLDFCRRPLYATHFECRSMNICAFSSSYPTWLPSALWRGLPYIFSFSPSPDDVKRKYKKKKIHLTRTCDCWLESFCCFVANAREWVRRREKESWERIFCVFRKKIQQVEERKAFEYFFYLRHTYGAIFFIWKFQFSLTSSLSLSLMWWYGKFLLASFCSVLFLEFFQLFISLFFALFLSVCEILFSCSCSEKKLWRKIFIFVFGFLGMKVCGRIYLIWIENFKKFNFVTFIL